MTAACDSSFPAWIVTGVVCLGLVGCGSSAERGAGTPLPALADSGSAQRAFRNLKERWHTTPADQQGELVRDFEHFLSTYPNDSQTRLARVYLAWLLVQGGDFPDARELVEQTRRGPAGAAADFAQVVEAALLLRYKQPHEALKLLRPVQGKLIDPLEAFYATRELVRSAMAANLYSEALSHVVEWVVRSPPARRPAVRTEVKALVANVPRRYLERAFESERPSDTSELPLVEAAEKQWFFDVISARLGAIAVNEGDRELARYVLQESPKSETDSEEPSELLRLATGVSESAAVVGKTVGLVLNLKTAVGRRRSSQTAAGLTQSLELLGPSDDKKNERLDLLVTDDVRDVDQGLAELAARGASLLVTGTTEEDATTAARFAARERIPVVLFLPPRVTTNYAFVLGVGDLEQVRLAGGGAHSSAALVTELECEVAAESATANGFPMAKWASEGRTALFLFGDGACSKRVMTELRGSKFTPEIWFGLESAHLWPGEAARGFHTLRAGRFPLAAGSLPLVTQLAQRLGHQPTWFETLGHDAAILLNHVFAELPDVQLQDDEAVAAFHAQVLDRLDRFQSEDLWSSTRAAFNDDMRLERSLEWQ